jgi:hypothetical protein
MSPEQANGLPVDPRSDLFSLGSVLYAMCTGRPPFRADSTPAVLRRVSEDRPRPIPEINPEIPPWLVRIMDGLHAKDPAHRFQSAAEVAEHLARLQQPASAPSGKTSRQPGRRGPLRHWAMAAAVLVALFGGLGLTEATGVTHVRELVTTVLRIHTPEGTLAVEVNDPQVKVTIDGDGEEIVITGAGPQEVRLRPGRYQVRASKAGVYVASSDTARMSGASPFPRTAAISSRGEAGSPRGNRSPAAIGPCGCGRYRGRTAVPETLPPERPSRRPSG